MAIAGKISDIIFELKQTGFYEKISSVIDMGDQDLNLNYEEITNNFKKFGIQFDENF